MVSPSSPSDLVQRTSLRWWPAAIVLALSGIALLWVHGHDDWSFQRQTLSGLGISVLSLVLLLVWWLAFSRAPRKWRIVTVLLVVAVSGFAVSLFRIRGFSGDVLPIVELRWARPSSSPLAKLPASLLPRQETVSAFDFPQFLGPERTAMLEVPIVNPDWQANPPQVLWRCSMGAAWSGWAIVGKRALTQEQRPEGEAVTCYELLTGKLLWSHADPAHYRTSLGGEGPRCTPAVVSNRVFALGATGILNCLDGATGKVLWSRQITEDAKSAVPEWGFAGSPLVWEGVVIVSAGGSSERSLLAYRTDSGELAWSAGSQRASYSSPFLATLAGRRQILAFNHRRISAHDAHTGQVLWEYPWGNGQPQVSTPVVVGTNRVLFSSGYGVGSELLEISPEPDGRLAVRSLWKSREMKSKYASLIQRNGFLYGLDDGVLACLDLKDGTRRWRGSRYGHGQGLWVNDLYLLMAENGELVLLKPSPESPGELHRFRLFRGKTWNPIALSGDLLLARTEQEAVCVRLSGQMPGPTTIRTGHKD